MKILAASAILCGLLLFAACAGESNGTGNTDEGNTAPQSPPAEKPPSPSPDPAPSEPPVASATETIVLDVEGMT